MTSMPNPTTRPLNGLGASGRWRFFCVTFFARASCLGSSCKPAFGDVAFCCATRGLQGRLERVLTSSTASSQALVRGLGSKVAFDVRHMDRCGPFWQATQWRCTARRVTIATAGYCSTYSTYIIAQRQPWPGQNAKALGEGLQALPCVQGVLCVNV